MKNKIILISTAHKTHGKCNVNNLLKILIKVKPEVVFIESSPKFINQVHNSKRPASLELTACIELKKYNPFRLLAIDSYPDSVNLDGVKNKISQIFNDIQKSNPEYSLLSEQIKINEFNYGFDYLNSQKSINDFERMNEIESIFVKNSANKDALDVYNYWLSFNKNREIEMLENIIDYSNNNNFNNAVFLCGAAHRKSLIDKIKLNKNTKIEWLFELP